MKNIVFIFLLLPIHNFPITIGSNTAVSRQDRGLFPATDSNNILLGFGNFVNGFKLENPTTTCTYDNLFPVCGRVNFGGGIFTLKKDLTFKNVTSVIRGGKIMGENHYIEFIEPQDIFNIPGPIEGFGDLLYTTQATMPGYPVTQSWSVNNTYVAVGGLAATGDELRVYTFDGTTLTLTSNGGVDLGTTVQEIRWHPTLYYLATCQLATTGNEVLIYQRNISNGTLVNTGGAKIGFDANACSWHPSGKFLLVETSNLTAQLQLFSFSTGSLTLTQSVYLSPSVQTYTDILQWSRGGNYVVIGTRINTGPELRMFSFNGTTLTYTANAEVGLDHACMDWSPTGTFIAVGLVGSSQNVRIFSHNVWNGTLTEEVTARINISATVNGIYWSNDGNGLIISTENGTSSQVIIYTFDKNKKTFTFQDSYNLGSSGYGVFASRDNKYIIEGLGATINNILMFSLQGTTAAGVETEPFYFKDTALVFNGTTLVRSPWYFDGSCVLDMRGHTMLSSGNGSLIVQPKATLTIQNTVINGLTANQLYCMTDNGSIILENCTWALTNDYTFSRGALQCANDVIFTGTNTFTYSSSRTSTIASHGRVYFDANTTFSYAPRVAKKNLLYFPDKSAQLYLDGATLFSTRTGLLFSEGTLFLDNKVTVSSQARNSGEAIIFDSTMQVNVLGAATLDVYGMALFL